MAKRDKIDDTELEAIAREFCRSALGGPGSEIAAIRERNLRAYNAMPEGEFAALDIEDRSTYVDASVADTVDGMIPQIIDVFVASSDAVECKAKKPGEDAEAQARSATGYLNHLFYVRNDGLNVLHDWLQDACLQKVGFVKVWAEEESEDAKQTYEGQTQEQLAALLVDGVQLTDEPQVDEQGGLTFTVIDQSKRVALHVACVPPNEMRVDANARWGAEPAAIGEVRQRRRFELEEMGYDLKGVGGENATFNPEADAGLGDGLSASAHELHESHKLFEYSELYMQLDVDGDGVAEWVQICLINGELVHSEQVDGHPYADICLMPRAHAYFGDCPADRAFLIQKEQTNLSRAMFDNVQFSTNQRTYINTTADVNIGDLLDNRAGGIVRGTGAPGDAFAPIPTIPLNQSAWQMQEWLAVRLENRTGFTRYSQGMDADSLNKTATGISIITSKADMRLRLMTRFAAQGVRKMFAKLLKLATKHQDAEDWFNVNGEWVPVLPTEWKDQFNIDINVGLGTGTKEQQANRVMAMIPLMQMGAQFGVVRPQHVAEAIRLMATVNEFKNPDKFADAEPQGLPSPEQFKQMQAEQQQQQQQMGEQMQQLGQENEQLKMQAEGAKLDAKRKDLQAFVEQESAKLEAQDAQLQSASDGFRNEVQGAQAQAESDKNVGAEVDALAQQVAMLTAMVSQLFTQQPDAMEGEGMDAGQMAPAAPLEEY